MFRLVEERTVVSGMAGVSEKGLKLTFSWQTWEVQGSRETLELWLVVVGDTGTSTQVLSPAFNAASDSWWASVSMSPARPGMDLLAGVSWTRSPTGSEMTGMPTQTAHSCSCVQRLGADSTKTRFWDVGVMRAVYAEEMQKPTCALFLVSGSSQAKSVHSLQRPRNAVWF